MCHVLNEAFHIKSSRYGIWQGGCLDAGAQLTAIGLRQEKVYYHLIGIELSPSPN